MLPADITREYVWDWIKNCAQQASWDAYQAIIAEPHVYFSIADEGIRDIEITDTVLGGGFFNKASECTEGGWEGIYTYLKERNSGVMFGEDLIAMNNAGISTVYPPQRETRDDPARLFLQLTTGPYPSPIALSSWDLEVVGWFLGVLCVCDPGVDSKEIVHCTYADLLAQNPVFEGMVVAGYDGEGYIFLVKKTCFDELFGRHEVFGHGMVWSDCFNERRRQQ